MSRWIFLILFFFQILVIGVWASYCDMLEKSYGNVTTKQYVSIHEKIKNVSIYWNNHNTRAASALVAVILRHLMGYQGVYLHQKSHEALQENEVMLALTDSTQASNFLPNFKNETEIVCPSRIDFGLKQFYVYIPPEYRNRKQCANVTSWRFFNNVTALQDCGFFDTSNSRKHVKIYTPKSVNTKSIEDLIPPTISFEKIINIPCVFLLRKVTTSTRSFLFFDDIWPDNPNISKLELPSCSPKAQTAKESMNTLVHIRPVNKSLILEYAPSISQISNLPYSLEDLQIIKEKENVTRNIEEAACEWVQDNLKKLNKWIKSDVNSSSDNRYSIVHLYDVNVENKKLHYHLPMLWAYEYKHTDYNNKPIIEIYNYPINSSNINEVKEIVDDYLVHNNTCLFHSRQQLLGAVVGNMENISKVVEAFSDINLPIFTYDTARVDTKSKRKLWRANVNSMHLVFAIKHFVLEMNWKRIAILSDVTNTAQNVLNDFKSFGGIDILDYSIRSEFSQLEAEILLQDLKSKNTRMILVNTNYENACNILSTVDRLQNKMDYIWMVQDWRFKNKSYNVTHITTSFLSENMRYVEKEDGWWKLRQEIKKNLWSSVNSWPKQVAGMVDAFVTLVEGFEAVFRRYPQTRHDIHTELTLREFERSIVGEKLGDVVKIRGITQFLTYNADTRSLQDTVVILEEWNGKQSELLARYRFNMTMLKWFVNVERTGRHYWMYRKVDVMNGKDGVLSLDGNNQCFISNVETICYDIFVFPIVGTLVTLVVFVLAFKFIYSPRYNYLNTI